jgi:predicted RNA-binding protein YlqC (UPF0109 family)
VSTFAIGSTSDWVNEGKKHERRHQAGYLESHPPQPFRTNQGHRRTRTCAPYGSTYMLLTVTQMMVDLPDEASVGIVETPESAVFRVKVAPSDREKLIEPGGRTERSLRNVLKVARMTHNLNVDLDISE